MSNTNMSNECVIYSVEIGGDHSRAGVFVDGVTTQVVEVLTPRSGKGAAANDNRQVLLEMLQNMVAELKQVAPPMQALTLSIGGMMRLQPQPNARGYGPFRDSEIFLSAPHIDGMKNAPLLSWLEQGQWGVPIHVENDVNAALRSAIGFPTAININMGTGIGGAVKRNNRVQHTPGSWSSYEIGHSFRWQLPEALTRKCDCGSMGCLEAAIGARALGERYGVRPENATPEIYERMRADVVELLAPAISDTAKKFGIGQVLLSGRAAWGFSNEFDLLGALQDKMRSIRPGVEVPDIDLIRFIETAGLAGVALAALDYEVI